MKVLTLKVSAELDAQLTGLASRRGTSKSAIVRQILSGALLRSGEEVEGTFGARAADLCGRADGPEDLSTNRAHMKGYGR